MARVVDSKVKVLGLNGNAAVAYAMKQINPDVVAAYPITPQTDCVERFAEYVSAGTVDTEFVTVESEHSAMSACIGAAAAGGRVMTAPRPMVWRSCGKSSISPPACVCLLS